MLKYTAIIFIFLSTSVYSQRLHERINYFNFYRHSKDLRNSYKHAIQKPAYSIVLRELRRLKFKKTAMAIAIVESGLRPEVCSNQRACGVWQIIPTTATWCGLRASERHDLIQSTQCAVRYLRHLTKRFNNYYVTIMAYNAGEARLEKAIKLAGSVDHNVLCDIDKRYLPMETCRYLPKVLAMMELIKEK